MKHYLFTYLTYSRGYFPRTRMTEKGHSLIGVTFNHITYKGCSSMHLTNMKIVDANKIKLQDAVIKYVDELIYLR